MIKTPLRYVVEWFAHPLGDGIPSLRTQEFATLREAKTFARQQVWHANVYRRDFYRDHDANGEFFNWTTTLIWEAA